MKVSIIIPVYYNEENLEPLYQDLKEKFIDVIDYDYEIVLVNDGSGDGSWDKMKELKKRDKNVKIYSLSRNFGSHAAVLCGIDHCTGDCALIKAADLQEPTEMIHEMVASWQSGNHVVLAVRDGRDESHRQEFFANSYYGMVRRFALPTMPPTGFDTYLVDRKVMEVLSRLDERNSALTGQILWSGFQTGTIHYRRLARKIGKSRWTLRKKVRLVMDTLFSFSNTPITFVEVVGLLSFIGSIIWIIVEIIAKVSGMVEVPGWTLLMIFQLFSFGVIMMTIGILGEYMWRTFDASRNRPTYIVEYKDEEFEKHE